MTSRTEKLPTIVDAKDVMAAGRYRYVMMGARAAGCVLANRLSADPACQVALPEAGGPDRRREFRIPAAFIRLFLTECDWNYRTTMQPWWSAASTCCAPPCSWASLTRSDTGAHAEEASRERSHHPSYQRWRSSRLPCSYNSRTINSCCNGFAPTAGTRRHIALEAMTFTESLRRGGACGCCLSSFSGVLPVICTGAAGAAGRRPTIRM